MAAAAARRLHYLEWVASNRRAVHEKSGGRCGYLHMADMEEGGYEDFSRDYWGEASSGQAALVLDLRGNEGGHVSELVLQRLSQPRLAVESPPHGRSAHVPYLAPPANLVVLIDEATSSDGEVVAAYLSSAAGAALVGARTWGGVYAMDTTELVDGTTVSHPSYSFQRRDGGEYLENVGVAPETEVRLSPDDHTAGRDAQLDAAVDVALERVAALAAAGEAQPTDDERRLAPSGGGGARGRRRAHGAARRR